MAGRRIAVTGETVSKRRLRNMARRADDLTPVWPKVGSYLSKVMVRQFRTNGAYLGRPWQPLDPKYKIRKRLDGFGGNHILVRTGGLRSEFTGRPMKVERYTAHTAEYGSDSDLARWHAQGTERNMRVVPQPRKGGRFKPYRPGTWYKPKKQGVPARPIMYSTPMMRRNIRDIVQAHVVGDPYMTVRDDV